MILEGPYLVDSNVLLHLVNQDSAEHVVVLACLKLLWEQGVDLTYTSQNVAELWNVCTRSADKNGFGLSVTATNKRASMVEAQLRLLEDLGAVHHEWRRLIVDAGVSGMLVYDARLVAAMKVHQIRTIITYNLRDFRRFANIVALSPPDILKKSESRA